MSEHPDSECCSVYRALERLDVRSCEVAEDEEDAIADILQNRMLEQAQKK